MFINSIDYKSVIGMTALNIVTQADSENRQRAELTAIEEISGYLRPKYDTAAIFSASAQERNLQIVMITCDIALYHLAASLGQKMGMDIREQRYKRAIEWLEGVRKGTVVPDLPTAKGPGGEPATPVHFGSETRHKHTW